MMVLSRRIFFTGLALFLLLSQISTTKADIVYGNQPEANEPLLQVFKWSSAESAKLGTNLTISVNITNWSTATAYNLTIIEPIFSEFALTYFEDYQKWDYVEVGPHASIFYQYTINLRAEGKYIIEPTVIEYVNVNSTQFKAQSYFIPIKIFDQPPPEDITHLWADLRNQAFIFLIIPIAIIIVNRYMRNR